MKTTIHNLDRFERVNKQLVALILEFQNELTVLTKTETTYNQELTVEIQSMIDSMDVILERILNDM